MVNTVKGSGSELERTKQWVKSLHSVHNATVLACLLPFSYRGNGVSNDKRYFEYKTYQRVLKILQSTLLCWSVCPSAYNSLRTCEWIFMKFNVGDSKLLLTHTSLG